MANYNYTTVEQIMGTVERALACPNVEFTVESSRGNIVRVELREWVAECGPREGETVRMFAYNGDKSGGTMRVNSAADRAQTVINILLALDARLKVGKHYFQPYENMLMVGAPNHPLYGHLVNIETGEVIY